MISKDKKRKLRGLLAKLEPEKKADILFRGLEEEVREIGERVATSKDYSQQIISLQWELQNLKGHILDKINDLPTTESVEKIKKVYIENLYLVEGKLKALIKQSEDDVSKLGTGLSEERKERSVIGDMVKELAESVQKLRIDVLSKGGGSMPLQVSVNETTANVRYADINFIASGATVSNNNTKKRTDITLLGGTPALPLNSVQFNNSNAFGGDSQFTWNPTTHRLGFGLGNSVIYPFGAGNSLRIVGYEELDLNPQGSGASGGTAPVYINDRVAFGAFNTIDILSGGVALGSTFANNYTAPSNGIIIEGNVGIGSSSYSPRGLLDIYGTAVTVGNVGSGSCTQQNGAYHYHNDGYFFQYALYAYKTVGTRKVFSATALTIDFTDDGLVSSNYRISINWGAVAGADGYIIRLLENDFDNKGESSDGGHYYKDVGNVTTYTDNGASAFTTGLLAYSISTIQPSLYADVAGDVFWNGGNLISTGSYGISPGSNIVSLFSIKNTGNVLVLETATDNYAGTAGGVSLTLVNEDFHNGALFTNKSLDVVDFQFNGPSTTFGINNKFLTVRWEGRNAFNRNSGNNARGEIQIGSTVEGDGIPAFCVGEQVVSLLRGRMSIRQSPAAPTAWLHLGPGTTLASSSPLKFTSGSLQTTAEAGAVEFLTDKWYATITTGAARKEVALVDAALTSGKLPVSTTNGRLTDSAGTGYAKVSSGTVSYQATPIPVADGGTGQTASRRLFTHFADAGNGTTVETDLYSDSIAAGKLTNNGDMIEAEYAGVFISSATATRQVKIYFGGTAIFDTGALTLSLSAAWTAYVNIIRVSSSVVRYAFSFTTEGAALAAYTAVGELTGLTLANAQVMKITGQAAGVGAATNDIVAKLGYIDYESI